MSDNDVELRANTLERVLIDGDLKSLSPEDRVRYYNKMCESLGLNPWTKPFSYIVLNGRLTLYALRDCTEQLRKIHGVSITNLQAQLLPDESYLVTATFTDKTGRTDQATGAVSLKGLSGENRTNKMMGAETKCKRRGTLSICGLGMLDETETAAIPGAKLVQGDEPMPGLPPLPRRLSERTAAAKLVDEHVVPALPARTVVQASYGSDEPTREPGQDDEPQLPLEPIPDAGELPVSKPELLALYSIITNEIKLYRDSASVADREQVRTHIKEWLGQHLGLESFEQIPVNKLVLVRRAVPALVKDVLGN